MGLHIVEGVIESALVRSTLYSLLAKSFKYPSEQVPEAAYEETLRDFLALRPGDNTLQDSIDALASDRALLNADGIRDKLEAEYNRLFAHLGSAKCPPYETEYGFENVFQKTEAMADIAGFYNAYGLEPSAADTERVDFISMELEFMSYLALHEAYAREHQENEHLEVCLDTQKKFIGEHLGRWVTIFTRILTQNTVNGFYKQLGVLTAELLDAEAARFDIILQKVTAPNTPEVQASFDCASCSPVSMENTTCRVVFEGVKEQ